jgi:sodium/potassium-transporting ATPase subunit alpha
VPLEVLAARLDCNTDTGLSLAEAKQRLARDGPNALTPPKATPKWRIMMR